MAFEFAWHLLRMDYLANLFDVEKIGNVVLAHIAMQPIGDEQKLNELDETWESGRSKQTRSSIEMTMSVVKAGIFGKAQFMETS